MRRIALAATWILATPGLVLLVLALIALAPVLWLSWIVARDWWESL